MDILAIAGLGLVSAIIALVLKQYKPEYGVFVSLMVGVVLFGMLITQVMPVLQRMQDIASDANVPIEGVQVLLKALGICFVIQIAADSCRDAGEAAIASKVEFGGKVLILLSALPLFEKILGYISQIIKG